MACAWLVAATDGAPALPATLAAEVEARDWGVVAELARSGFASPRTTSVGRLFDAVAALCGLRARVLYEGQAAAELESIAAPGERGSYPLALVERCAGDPPASPAPLCLDARELVLAVARDAGAGVPAPAIAARFHNSLADATGAACASVARERRLELACLSGGVFQNRVLLERTATAVRSAGLQVVVPERLPPNDGGIAYGQAAVAATRAQLR